MNINKSNRTKKSYTSSINEIVKEINQSQDDTAMQDLLDFINSEKEIIEVENEMA